jgi:hypothetical protein
MSSVAVFLVLGGGAYAATQLPRNTVGRRQLKKNAVTSAKVKDRSLLAKDFKAGQLPAGPRGPQGPEGPLNPNAVSAQNADKLDGLDSTEFVRANGKAADADKLDGIDATDIARSNVMFAAAGVQTFTVPAQVTGILAELRGAGGGGNFFNACGSGGQGGFVRAYLAVDRGSTLTISVGTGGFHGSGTSNPTAGGASSLSNGATILLAASGGGAGMCSAGGAGGDVTVTAPAVGVEEASGADGTLSGSSSVGARGAGAPRFFGSGDDSGPGITGFRGGGGYVLLHLLR